MTSNIQEAGRAAPAASTKKAARPLCAGITAALLLSCAPAALHAETSNAELAKEIAELKAQIHALKGAISSTRTEVRKVKVVAAPYAPAFVPPPGATPVFVTADKKMQFGALTITPGGFIEGASVFRTRASGADLGTNFGVAFPFTPSSHTNETRFSARGTRPSLLIEGAITPSYVVSGYTEFDFLGAAQTANDNQTNSYQPRIRHLYATLDANDYGMHVLAGQAYSLLTLNAKGIAPRNELTPPNIDQSQNVGSLYARQTQIRLVKDFNKKLWLGVSLEASQTTSTTSACDSTNNSGGATPVGPALPGVANITCGIAGSQQYSGLSNLSLNHVPDVIGKVAYEATLADRDVHFEGTGIYRNFYDRVQNVALAGYPATNKNTNGYGVGGGLVVPVIPKRLDFQVNGLYGIGIGRYGASQLADTTFNPDGSQRPIREAIAMAGLTFHATPSIDLYAFAGIEKEFTSYVNTNAAGTASTGLGGPSAVDTGCFIEGSAAATCNGLTKRTYELTGGMWDKIYKGGFGEVRAGLQYSYVNREIANTPGLATPKATNQIVFTSLRYYPFQ